MEPAAQTYPRPEGLKFPDAPGQQRAARLEPSLQFWVVRSWLPALPRRNQERYSAAWQERLARLRLVKSALRDWRQALAECGPTQPIVGWYRSKVMKPWLMALSRSRVARSVVVAARRSAQSFELQPLQPFPRGVPEKRAAAAMAQPRRLPAVKPEPVAEPLQVPRQPAAAVLRLPPR